MNTPFKLNSDSIELAKLLKATGLCESGGQAKYVIGEKLVKVNGIIETRKAFKVMAGMSVQFQDCVIEVSS